MKRSLILTAIILAGVYSENALAGVVGTFDISGGATISENSITWTSVPTSIADQTTIGPGPTGIYSTLANATAGINGLTLATEPVGSTFTSASFLSFPSEPALSPLKINFIFSGTNGSAGCGASPAAAGQLCTPSPPGYPSALNFQNESAAGGLQSSASFAVSGVSADGKDTWSGVFALQFSTESFQDVLSAFPGGSVTNDYAGIITVSAVPTSSVPEPSGLSLVGFGMLALLFSSGRWKRLRS